MLAKPRTSESMWSVFPLLLQIHSPLTFVLLCSPEDRPVWTSSHPLSHTDLQVQSENIGGEEALRSARGRRISSWFLCPDSLVPTQGGISQWKFSVCPSPGPFRPRGANWKDLDKQVWRHHFSLGQRLGRLADVILSSLNGSSESHFPLRGIIWDNNLTSFANMTLQVLYFLPYNVALNVRKVGAMDSDPGLLGIWTLRTWYWTKISQVLFKKLFVY